MEKSGKVSMPNPEITNSVGDLHQELDSLVSQVESIHGTTLKCRQKCTDCCIDDVTIFSVEAEWISQGFPDGIPGNVHTRGACAFLDQRGLCRIYERRPYVCKTQGLPLRWIEESGSDEYVERRDICELNEDSVDILGLTEDQCWTIGPFEGRLATLQVQATHGDLQRVSLRELAHKFVARATV